MALHKRTDNFLNAPLVPFFIAAVLCILFDRNIAPDVYFWFINIVVFLLLFLGCWIIRLIDPELEFERPEKQGTRISYCLRLICWQIGNKFLFGNLCAWAICGLVFGLRHELYFNRFPEKEIGLYVNEDGIFDSLELRVSSSPEVRRYDNAEHFPYGAFEKTSFIAEVLTVKNGEEWEPFTGRIAVSVTGNAAYLHIGDTIKCFGKLALISRADNPGDRDRSLYFRSQRILTSLSISKPANIELYHNENTSKCVRYANYFERTRSKLGSILTENLSERNAAVARGMTLGFRSDVDEETNDSFRRTGTIHLLAISGLHVSLVIGAFVFFLRRLCFPTRFVCLAAISIALFYLFLTDVRIPVIRATVLIVTVSVGTLIGRRGLSLNSLALAALIILAWNPCELFQLGSQLSFMATGSFLWARRLSLYDRAALDVEQYQSRTKEVENGSASTSWWSRFFFSKSGEKKIASNKSGFIVRWMKLLWNSFFKNFYEAGKTGFGIWLVGTPLILRTTHLFTPIALIANPLIWLPATFALLMAFSLIFLGLAAETAPSLLGWSVPLAAYLTDLGFDCFLGVLDFCASPSFAAYKIPSPPDWLLWLFYVPLVFWTLFPKTRPCKLYLTLGLLVWINVFILADLGVRFNDLKTDSLRVNVFSVGHGCAILGHFPDGRTFLYDCGSLSNSRHAADVVAKELWEEQRTHIDLAIISHADYDHYSGLEHLLELVNIDRIGVSPMMFKKENKQLKEFEDLLYRSNIPVETIMKCGSLDGAGFPELFVLHPDVDDSVDEVIEANPYSIVLGVEHLGRRLMFPGDLDTSSAGFLRNDPIGFDLLLAPHHGGKSENYAELLDWALPDWIVISGGNLLRNRATEERLRKDGFKVFHTADDGCVSVEIKRSELDPELGRMIIKTFRSNKYIDSDLRTIR